MQALKSGQLPADFNINEGDSVPISESAQQDNMTADGKEANNEPKESESEEKKDEPSEMEEVCILLNVFIFICLISQCIQAVVFLF